MQAPEGRYTATTHQACRRATKLREQPGPYKEEGAPHLQLRQRALPSGDGGGGQEGRKEGGGLGFPSRTLAGMTRGEGGLPVLSTVVGGSVDK